MVLMIVGIVTTSRFRNVPTWFKGMPGLSTCRSFLANQIHVCICVSILHISDP